MQETAQSKRNQQRAALLVEYYSIIGKRRRREIERQCCFTHQLIPESQHERDADSASAWDGQLAAMKRAVHKIVETSRGLTQKEMNINLNKLDNKVKALETKIDAMQQAIDDKFSAVLAAVSKQQTPAAEPPVAMGAVTRVSAEAPVPAPAT